MSSDQLSIIIPAYNERSTLGQIVYKINKVDIDKVTYEVIVVDDGSSDKTTEIARNHPGIDLFLRHDCNKGKGAAVRTGLRAASGNIFVIQDADLELNPADFPDMIELIISKGAHVVYGDRLAKQNNQVSHWHYYLGGRIMTVVTNTLFNANISDQPVCYKMFTDHAYNSVDLSADGFEFCSEITAQFLLQEFDIHEVPIEYNPRSKSNGKKLTPVDGLIGIWTMIKHRFGSQ